MVSRGEADVRVRLGPREVDLPFDVADRILVVPLRVALDKSGTVPEDGAG